MKRFGLEKKMLTADELTALRTILYLHCGEDGLYVKAAASTLVEMEWVTEVTAYGYQSDLRITVIRDGVEVWTVQIDRKEKDALRRHVDSLVDSVEVM